MALPPKKRRKLWVWTAVDRISGRLLDWELGNRDSFTLAKLLNRLKRYNVTIYYTDKWDSYAELIPANMLVQTKRETHHVERNNSRLRHWFGRFRRRTLIVSKSGEMVDATLALFATFWVNGSHEYLLSLIS
jgi:insertion element IS1 protein InsB